MQPSGERGTRNRWSRAGLTEPFATGKESEGFDVLLDGRAAVPVNARTVGELRAGDQFGEIAVLHGVPRRADVATLSPAVTSSLHRDDFVLAVRSRIVQG